MEIDEQLGACGWVVQDYKHAAVAAAQGVAVREVPTEAGPADYVLFVERQAVGVIEAKKAGSTLTGVEPQTRKYRAAYPEELPAFLGGRRAAVRLRVHRGRDPLHVRARPGARVPAGVHVPPARDAGPLGRHLHRPHPARGLRRPSDAAARHPRPARARARPAAPVAGAGPRRSETWRSRCGPTVRGR